MGSLEGRNPKSKARICNAAVIQNLASLGSLVARNPQPKPESRIWCQRGANRNPESAAASRIRVAIARIQNGSSQNPDMPELAAALHPADRIQNGE